MFKLYTAPVCHIISTSNYVSEFRIKIIEMLNNKQDVHCTLLVIQSNFIKSFF